MTKPLTLVADTVVLATPNEFAREVLDTRLRPLVVDALSRELSREVQVAVTVKPEVAAVPEGATADELDEPGPVPAGVSVVDEPYPREGAAAAAEAQRGPHG